MFDFGRKKTPGSFVASSPAARGAFARLRAGLARNLGNTGKVLDHLLSGTRQLENDLLDEGATAGRTDIPTGDRAGWLDTKTHRTREQTFVERTEKKLDPDAPNEAVLFVGADTDQCALNRAPQFLGAVGLGGLALTNLDGTKKGGILSSMVVDWYTPSPARSSPAVAIGRLIEPLSAVFSPPACHDDPF